ncbi:MAG TPA: thioredoxin-dependent thiol peroxidase [Candidatus Saccharimonadales bacterium]|nr:thioredoxin-dependent thiol peroxidase [Candidatus Saccharimonadales bacterium]
MKAPDFNLPDQDGKNHSLADYRGKWLVLYFYPKDDTPGCTKEACSFRDGRQALVEAGLEVAGVSKDTVASHKKFVDKYQLNFTLLADPELTTIKAYKSWGLKKFMGREFEGTLRNTYLINPKGEIVKTYEKVKPDQHAMQILEDFEALAK